MDPDSLLFLCSQSLAFFYHRILVWLEFLPGRPLLDDAACQTGRQGTKQILHGIGSPVFSQQNGRLISLQHKGSIVCPLFFTGTVKPFDRRPVVAPHVLSVPGAELKFGQHRPGLNCLNGLFKLGHVNSVDDSRFCKFYLCRYGIFPFF
jgi:hypothetical protein